MNVPTGQALATVLLRLERLHPRKIDLSLDRLRGLLNALGHPERSLPPVIHVAGTNGKGSTVAMLRAVLEAGGARVHAYTSPHLVRFNERIRVTGHLIDDAALLTLIAEVEEVNGGRPITFFEVTTAVAFLAFARQPADMLLLEVGLGGRLDATNVVDRPAATVITPVSLDHLDWFGPDLAGIAVEKAGIMKPGVPAIIGPQSQAADAVFAARGLELGAPLFRAGPDWRVEERGEAWRYEGQRWRLDLPAPSLPGRHQIDNAGAAVACLEQLPELAVTADQIASGLARIDWPGRLQRLTRGPLIRLLEDLAGGEAELWLDGGHNPAGGAALAAMARRWRQQDCRPLSLILGMQKTKDVAGFLQPLLPLVTKIATLAIPDTPASLTAEELAAAAAREGADVHLAGSLEAALRALASGAVAGEGAPRLLICGSLHLAGAVLVENS